MDPEWQALRSRVEDMICKWLEKKNPNQLSSELKQSLRSIAKKLEESMFNESTNKEDYLIKSNTGIELRMANMLNQFRRYQQTMANHNLPSSSSTSGMMIPTPRISHNSTKIMQMLEMENNQGIEPTSGTAGTMSNDYQLSHGNISINQPQSFSMSASIDAGCPVIPQMIPTPGFNSTGTSQVRLQTMPMNSCYNNGSGPLGAYTSMLTPVQPQKQQQHNNLGGQEGPCMPLVPMNQRNSFQVFGDGMMNNNNGLVLLGNNMQQLMNGPTMSEGYIGVGGRYRNSTEPVQQGFSLPQIQQRMPNRQDSLQLQIPISSISHNLIGTMQMPTMENNQWINPTSGRAGTMSNRYHISHGNMPINQPAGSSSMFASKVVQHPMTQMIPTPGFNSTSTSQGSPLTIPMKSDYSNGSGTLGADSSMLPIIQPQKQRQYNNLGRQVWPGMKSVPINHKHSSQGFGDGMMNNNNGIELPGNNMQQLMNGLHDLPRTMSNGDKISYRDMSVNQPGNMSTAVTYGNSRMPVQQDFSPQKIQQKILFTLPPQQGASMMGEGTLAEQIDLTRNFDNTAGLSNMSSFRNVNKISAFVASCQSIPRSNMHTNSNQADSWQNYGISGNQRKPQQQQQQSTMTSCGSNIISGQSSLGSTHSIGLFGAINREQAMPECLSRLVNCDMPFGNNSGPLSGSNALNQIVQSGEFSSNNGHMNGQLSGEGRLQQPYSTPVQHQTRWRPTQQMHQVQQMQRNNHLIIADNNNSNNNNVVIEKNQVSQNESNQSYMSISSHGVRPPAPKDSNTVVVSKKGSFQLSQQNMQVEMTILLIHVESCSLPVGHCPIKNCVPMQQLLKHIDTCYQKQCQVQLCLIAKMARHHFHNCQKMNCPVNVEVQKSLEMRKQKSLLLNDGSKNDRNAMEVEGKMKIVAGLVPLHAPISSHVSSSASAPSAAKSSKKRMNQLDVSKCPHQPFQQPVQKRCRINTVLSPLSVSSTNQSFSVRQEEFPTEQNISSIPAKHELVVKMDPTLQNLQIPSSMSGMSSVQMGYDLGRNGENASEPKETEQEEDMAAGQSGAPQITGDGDINMIRSFQTNADPTGASEIMHLVKKQESSLTVQTEDRSDENASEAEEMEIKEDGVAVMSEKSKIRGVSLIDFFTPEQVREHINSIKQWIGKKKAKVVKEQSILNNDDLCQLCGFEKSSFELPKIFCNLCGVYIKRHAMYYTTGTQKHICIPCFDETKGETIEVEGRTFPKVGLEKKKNIDKAAELWVQCDKCQSWLHQICALFNGHRNDHVQAEYTCPNCYINEVERGEREPLPQSDMFCAKDLPRTILSDHIENRLVKRLKQERQDRADHSGKSFNEVPGAEGLVVRVVSSVDKKLDVKPRFLEMFQKENYPTEFPYKSKAILLFQKIEGVEVCILGMFVQEYGTECAFPNQRCVYLSYLDSVKYFRPDIKTVSGGRLRTFVYHEILIGYLDYCKRRGFTSCYIWACPPNKGVDYIFNCHPEIQKTPKPGQLREWYWSMLKKAQKENIVVDQTTLHDYYFTKQGESRANVTATRLPYFDGDRWPNNAECIITQLLSPEENNSMPQKGKMKKAAIAKDAGHTNPSDNALMEKLRESLEPFREGMIMVHLQHPCSHCHILMVSGTRWVCNSCNNFNLCDSCHKADQICEASERHPAYSSETHTLTPVPIIDVPHDTKDKDLSIENKWFDTRLAFLELCEGKHYQFSTLRQAKHSSMMILYHLGVENKQ